MEVAKLSNIKEKDQKLEEAAKIREELNTNFQKKAEQKLMQKMELTKENRATLMNNLIEKLKKTVSDFCGILNNLNKEFSQRFFLVLKGQQN